MKKARGLLTKGSGVFFLVLGMPRQAVDSKDIQRFG